MRNLTFAKLALLGVAVSGLSACTVTNRPNVGLSGSSSNLIARVTPDKGEGGVYKVGEAVKLNVTTRTAGYVTLLALNSDNTVNVLVQNARVTEGTTTFPRIGEATFTVAPPLGVQRVRAIFTRERPTTEIVVRGVYDGVRWNTMTSEYLAPYPLPDRDVQETYLYIR